MGLESHAADLAKLATNPEARLENPSLPVAEIKAAEGVVG